MAFTSLSGPTWIYGLLRTILPGELGPAGLADPNQDAGPSGTYQGDSIPDVRMYLPSDKAGGFNGSIFAAKDLAYLQSVEGIPAASGAANIAAAANAVLNTPMTLVSTPSVGVALNIPIMPYTGFMNGAAAATNAPIVLDFGFAWGNCTSGQASIVVADSTQFAIGMPLVIAHVGTASTNQPLLTNVTGIVDATHITVGPNVPQATNATAPIGAGNIWGIREGQGYPVPIAHYPYLAGGVGLFLDPSQSIARNVRVVGVAGGAGGNIDITGWDIYWQPMTERIAATAGNTTTYGKKAFKAIASVTPRFADAHTYSIGTGDTFGFHFRSDKWEYTNVFWNATFMNVAQGWTAADRTNPALNTSGDVRGTVQTSAAGAGTGIGATASNGTVVSLAMSGVRLAIFQSMPLWNMLSGTPANPAPMFGSTQSPT